MLNQSKTLPATFRHRLTAPWLPKLALALCLTFVAPPASADYSPARPGAPNDEASENDAPVVKKKKKKKRSRIPPSLINLAGFRLNGRFDLAYEVDGFALDNTDDAKNSLRNYHHFIFVSRNRQSEFFSFNAEILDLSFYEVGLKFGEKHQLRFGKVLVPFGADPLFHRSYGGVSGIDQKMLPFVWAELGAVLSCNLHQAGMTSIDNEFFAVSGITGDADKALSLTGPADAGTVALGDRLRVGFGKWSSTVSLYWDRYDGDYNMLLWGIDVAAGYGFIPGLKNLSMQAGFIRAEVQGSEKSGLINYFHFGDYLQLDYRLPAHMGWRYRAAIVAMENHKGLFFDDRDSKKTSADTMAHSFSLWKRHHGFSVTAELIVNVEAAGEVDNDLFRLTTAVDF